jgi:acetyl esterase/lipase
MADQFKRPPFDPGYKNAGGFPNPNKIFDVETLRNGMNAAGMDANSIAKKYPQYTHSEIITPGIPGLSDIPVNLALYQVSPLISPTPKEGSGWPNGRPVIYHTHGGGQYSGDRYFGLEFPMSHVSPSDNIVFVSPEYRLAPEHPAPAGTYDVYAGLVYIVDHAKELDIDPEKIVLYGTSGGAAVAASAALLSRKLGGPKCRALVLDIPMLDDRQDVTSSAKQFWEGTIWPGWMEERAWNAVLGDGDRTDPDGVKVAGRADSLAGLPLTFIDVGECECMRDQAVAFATRIWKDGGSAELHVWPGVYHGGAMFEPGVPVGEEMIRVQKAFLKRVLGLYKGEDEKRLNL